jgi:hypothetical protein
MAAAPRTPARKLRSLAAQKLGILGSKNGGDYEVFIEGFFRGKGGTKSNGIGRFLWLRFGTELVPDT